jgi:hypothetical protein
MPVLAFKDKYPRSCNSRLQDRRRLPLSSAHIQHLPAQRIGSHCSIDLLPQKKAACAIVPRSKASSEAILNFSPHVSGSKSFKLGEVL